MRREDGFKWSDTDCVFTKVLSIIIVIYPFLSFIFIIKFWQLVTKAIYLLIHIITSYLILFIWVLLWSNTECLFTKAAPICERNIRREKEEEAEEKEEMKEMIEEIEEEGEEEDEDKTGS